MLDLSISLYRLRNYDYLYFIIHLVVYQFPRTRVMDKHSTTQHIHYFMYEYDRAAHVYL